MTPSSSIRRSRAVRMSRGAPVLAAISLNRLTPRTSSRMTSSDHFSPMTSSAPATEQCRGFAVRVAGVTPTVCHRGLAIQTYSAKVASRELENPTDSPEAVMTAAPLERARANHANHARTAGVDIAEHAADKLARLAPSYDGIEFMRAIKRGDLPVPPIA